MSLDFLKPSLGLRAHLVHPCCRSVLQLGMLFVFPRSLGGAECVTLLAALDFVAGYFGQERTPATLANKFVDGSNHIHRKDDVRSSAQTLLHTHSVT